MSKEFEIVELNMENEDNQSTNSWDCYCGPINEMDCYWR